jgi:hypothetical protein
VCTRLHGEDGGESSSGDARGSVVRVEKRFWGYWIRLTAANAVFELAPGLELADERRVSAGVFTQNNNTRISCDARGISWLASFGERD